MEQVTLELKTLEGKIVTRTIDISNIQYRSCSEGVTRLKITPADPEIQRKRLLEWIEERGNQQHETQLSLVSWYVH